MATSDMYKNSYTGKDNYIYLNDSTSAAKFPGASIFADGAAYTSDGSSWDATTVKSYTVGGPCNQVKVILNGLTGATHFIATVVKY